MVLRHRRIRSACAADHVTSRLVGPQSNVARVPQVAVRGDLQVLELSDQVGPQPAARVDFSAVKPTPQRPPCASGRLTNGQAVVSRPRNSR